MAALRCQHCDKPLTSTEIRDGWCESCGKRVPPGLISAAARGETELAPPRPVSSSREAPVSDVAVARSNTLLGWGMVRAGLAQVFVGLIPLAVGLGLLFVLSMDEYAGAGKIPGTGQRVLRLLTVLLIVIGGVVAAAGMCMGCAAPSDPGPRGWAIGVAVCTTLLVLTFLLQNTFQFENDRVELENLRRPFRPLKPGSEPQRQEPPYGERVMKALRYALEGTVWLAGGLFLSFLRGTGSALRSSAVATNAVVYLVVFVVVGGASVAIRFAATEGSISSEILKALAWVKVGVLVLLAVWLLAVVGLARRTVTRALAR